MTGQFSLKRTATAVPKDRRRIPTYPQTRRRTINLRFEQRDGGYLVHAWGDAFPDDGAGGYVGRSSLPPQTVQAAVINLRDTWQRLVIERREETDAGAEYPFAERWDLRTGTADGAQGGPGGRNLLAEVGPRLAQAGHQLFTLLFCRGDDGLAEIESCLEEALAAGPQIISVHSDDLFVPWSMLYTPVGGQDVPESADDGWGMAGFWGYRHLVEHCFSRVATFDARIHAPHGRPTVGLNLDPRVDEHFPPTPFVAAMIEFFARHGETAIRTSRKELQAALTSPDFAEQILYFGCHGLVGGTANGDGLGEPWLSLADDEPIRYTDLLAWLTPAPLPASPVVFVNACQGGQMYSRFYPSFGVALLAGGANCLVGPQIDLPRAFAREYSRRFFESLLAGDRIGDISRNLAREFADTYHNPLGLIFSIYRGLDTHFFNEETARFEPGTEPVGDA